MPSNKHPQQSGFVLPSLLMVTLILLVVATAILGSGTTSLRVATFDQQSDQAQFAAEAGLVRAAEEFARKGSLPDSYERELEGTHSQFIITVTENAGEVEKQVPGGPIIPPSTTYLMSEGISENGTRRKAGVLFSMGLQAFKVGALGKQMTIDKATFDAYNSEDGPYQASDTISNLPLLASNTNTIDDGLTFDFTDAEVNGNVFIGPGGDPVAQVSQNGGNIGDVSAMAKTIDIKDIEVPEAPEAGGASVPSVGNFQLLNIDSVTGRLRFSDGLGLEFEVDPSKSYPNNLILPPNLENWKDTQTVRDSDGNLVTQTTATIQVTGAPYHRVTVIAENFDSTYYGGGEHASGPNEQLRNLIFDPAKFDGASSPIASVTNPVTLPPGHYDSVTVKDGWTASLADEGVYVIKNLNVTDTSRLSLPSSGKNVTLYVTESLTVAGEDALLNQTLKAPKMKLFYTGGGAVQLAGGSKSYFTLVAPDADITLESPNSVIRTQFFGALVGKNVAISNANFHFDTATSGIGTGTQGSALSVIHRHRL